MFTVVPSVATSEDPAVKAFVARVRADAGAEAVVSNYVVTHDNALIALKAAIEKAGKVDKEAIVNALAGLVIRSPTGPVTIDQNHYATMNMLIAKTRGARPRHRPRAGRDCAATGMQIVGSLTAAGIARQPEQ